LNRTGNNRQRQVNQQRPAGKGNASRRSGGQRRPQQGHRPRNQSAPRQQRPLTEEEICRREEAMARREAEMARRAEEIARRREAAVRRKIALRQKRKKQFRRMVVVTGQRFVILLAMFALLLGLSTGVFFLRLHTGNHTDPAEYVFRLGNVYDRSNRNETIRSENSLYFQGKLYLDALEIAEYLNFTTAGDVNGLRLLLNNEAGDEAVFYMNDNTVVLNGITERLSAAPFYREGTFYLPAEFFVRYVSGIAVTEDSEELEVTFAPALTEDCQRELKASLDDEGRLTNSNFVFVYQDQAIRVKASQPSEVIKENSLDDEILLATDAAYISGLAAMKKEMAAAILAAPEEEKQAVREEYEETIEEFRLKRLLAISQEIAENQLGLNTGKDEGDERENY